MTHSVPPDLISIGPRQPNWKVYSELGALVLDARISGTSSFDAVEIRWPHMEPKEVRPFVAWLQERGMVEEIDIWRTA